MIRFEKVTPKNFEDVINLKMKDFQVGFMENNLYSLAESKVFDYLEPRAIYDDETLIGFMLYYYQPNGIVREMGPGEGVHEIHADGMDYVYFKRLMLDGSFQGKGLGRAALTAAVEYFKQVGFVSTGEVRKTLRPGTEDAYDEELVRRLYF